MLRMFSAARQLGNVNDGTAEFELKGIFSPGQTVDIIQVGNDPDGNSRDDLIVDWELSLDKGISWNTVNEEVVEGNPAHYQLGTDIEPGSLLRAAVTYLDGEGNTENVYSSTEKIKAFNGTAEFELKGLFSPGQTVRSFRFPMILTVTA